MLLLDERMSKSNPFIGMLPKMDQEELKDILDEPQLKPINICTEQGQRSAAARDGIMTVAALLNTEGEVGQGQCGQGEKGQGATQRAGSFFTRYRCRTGIGPRTSRTSAYRRTASSFTRKCCSNVGASPPA